MTHTDRHTAVIIVAAGIGSRFGGELPKQFVDLGGRPLLMVAIERMRSALPTAQIVVVLHQDYFGLWEQLVSEHPEFDASGITLTTGGATRWESVAHALATLPQEIDTVLVHDAARPLVYRDVIQSMIRALEGGSIGVVPVVKVSDSLRAADGDGSHAINRETMRAVQTPQAFPRHIIDEAYRQPYSPTFTDDASVVEAIYPGAIDLVEGNVNTLKITHPADLAALRYILDYES